MLLTDFQQQLYVRGSLSRLEEAIKEIREDEEYTIGDLFALFSLCDDLKDSYLSFRKKDETASENKGQA